MPVIFVHRTRESTEYTVLTHIGVWVKPLINILSILFCLLVVSELPALIRLIGGQLPPPQPQGLKLIKRIACTRFALNVRAETRFLGSLNQFLKKNIIQIAFQYFDEIYVARMTVSQTM